MSKNILQSIQSELKAPKGQTNKFGGYKYRSAEDILEAVKPLLKKYTCDLTISDEVVEVEGRVYVKATATLCTDATEACILAEVSAFAREAEVKKGMDEAQITGATSSYARKYASNGVFAIDETKDPDATNKHGKDTKTADVPNYDPPKTKDRDDTDRRSWKGLCDSAAKKGVDHFRDWFKGNRDDIKTDCGVEGMTEVYNYFIKVGESLASKNK